MSNPFANAIGMAGVIHAVFAIIFIVYAEVRGEDTTVGLIIFLFAIACITASEKIHRRAREECASSINKDKK